MEYLSPFHLIYDDPAQADLSAMPSFQKIKRKLLAKYELVDNEALQIKGVWLNRGDALKLIEDLKDESQMDFHQKVFSNPNLLDFLEEGSLAILESPDEGFTDEFRNKISPYFSKKFGELFIKAFKDAATILQFAKFPLEIYVNETDENVAYSKVYSSLKNISVELETMHYEVSKKDLVKNAKSLEKVLPTTLIKRINTLPVYFEDARELIAEEIHAMACRVNDDAQKYGLALDVLKFGSRIKVGDQVKEEYNRVYKILKGIGSLNDNSNVDGWGKVILYFIKAVIIILFLVFRMNSCNDREHRTIIHSPNILNNPNFKIKIDSILKSKNKDNPTINFKDWKEGR